MANESKTVSEKKEQKSGAAVSYRITCNNGNQRTLRNP